MTERVYFPGIDMLRFFCAIAVVLFHFSYHTNTHREMFWGGWVGVQVFFVISGIVICQSARNRGAGHFLYSRGLRLYPAAIVCAILGGGVQLIFGSLGPDRFSAEVLLRSVVLFPSGPFLASAYWTIPVEIAFYIIVAFAIWIDGFRRPIIYAWALIGLSSIYLLPYTLHTFGSWNAPFLEFGYGWKNVLLFRHGVYFALGILVFISLERRDLKSLALPVSICLLLSFSEISCRASEVIAGLAGSNEPAAVNFFGPHFLFLVAMGWIILTARVSIRSSSALRIARGAGLATYPLYLIHESIGYLLKPFLEQQAGLPVGLASITLTAVLTLVIAGVIAAFLEPMVRFHLVRITGWLKVLPT